MDRQKVNQVGNRRLGGLSILLQLITGGCMGAEQMTACIWESVRTRLCESCTPAAFQWLAS